MRPSAAALMPELESDALTTLELMDSFFEEMSDATTVAASVISAVKKKALAKC